MRETQSRFLRRFLDRADFLHRERRRESTGSLLPGSRSVHPCLAVLTVLAMPVQADGLSWRVDARTPGPGTGCCMVLAGATQGEDGGADSTLDSWLVMRERPPANMPPANTPDAAAVATHPTMQTATKTATQTTVLPKRSEAETDWRLMPFVAAQSSGGMAGQPIPLSIAVTSPYGQPNPQHEAITYVTIGDLPEKASLSNGERGADGVWKVPLEGLPDLTLTLPADISDPVSLRITAVTDHGGGVIARQAVTLAVPVAEAVAAAEPSGMDKPPLPAQGGSSQGIEAAAVPETVEPDPNPAAAGSSTPSSPQEPQQSEPIVSETALGPAPDPAPSPAPDQSADRGPAPSVDREVAAAPPVEAPATVPAAVQPVTAAPSPPEPPVSTVALAAIPAVAAPPPEPQRPQPREAAVQRPAKPPSTIPEATLMKRGDDLFAQGDLAGARLYYEMAAETGNAKAALALGRTHDPLVHERLHVRGLPPDPEQAASWYRRAIAAGSGDAEQQLQKLTVWLAGRSR